MKIEIHTLSLTEEISNYILQLSVFQSFIGTDLPFKTEQLEHVIQ